ncbi:hypothetical protein WA026_018789 [Henosepilachna vigintioctopunctata]|uniref:Cytochrome P450 n=1 Tax=Henosepilachna vigintioctopunctata TaxID=420089 RepID=A0AAW1TVL7_9CUCU
MRRNVKELRPHKTLRTWLLTYPVIATYDYVDLEKILGSSANNTKGPAYDALRDWLHDGLLISTGDKWFSRRKMLTPAYHFKILQKFLHIFNKESTNFINNVINEKCKNLDTLPIVTKYTLNSICETAMGTCLDESSDGDAYRKAVYDIGVIAMERMLKIWLMFDFIFRFSKHYDSHKKTLQILHGFSASVIEKRKKDLNILRHNSEDIYSIMDARQQSMLDLLLAVQMDGENISDDGIKEEVNTFMFEGHDTTSMSICYTLMLLANNKHCQELIYDEIISVCGTESGELSYMNLQSLKYMERCIKESLRLYPSVPMIARTMGEDVKCHTGLVIPKDCMLIISIFELHRSDDLYPDPEKFDPDRFLPENVIKRHPYAYIPFSAGARNCIGQKFAMMEMKCLLAKIIRSFILEPIDTPESVNFITDIILRPKDPVRVKFVPRIQ